MKYEAVVALLSRGWLFGYIVSALNENYNNSRLNVNGNNDDSNRNGYAFGMALGLKLLR